MKSILMGQLSNLKNWTIFEYFNEQGTKKEILTLLFELVKFFVEVSPELDVKKVLRTEQTRNRYDCWRRISYPGSHRLNSEDTCISLGL